jgi:hypothetical protein
MRVQQNELIEARPKKLTEHTMPTPSEKLAESLEILAKLQRKYGAAIRAKDISRTHRDRLLTNGFLLRVMNGWLIPSRPDDVGVSPIRSKAEDERSEGLHKRSAEDCGKPLHRARAAPSAGLVSTFVRVSAQDL